MALVALGTLFALVPLRSLGNLSFRLGLLLNEVPIAGFYWLLIWTSLAFVQGDLNSLGGWTTVGLTVVAWRGLQARPAVEHAMAEALGAGWRTAIDPKLAARLRRHLPLARILFRPFFTRRRDVERVANISYGDAGRKNLLDLYRHRARPSGGPVLIHLHAVAITRAGRTANPSRGSTGSRARAGYVSARTTACGPPRSTPMLFVSGSSAGGHMASLAALTPNDPTFQPGFEDADTSVTAAIGLNGYYGNYYGQGAASSPLAYVRPDAATKAVATAAPATTLFVLPWRPFDITPWSPSLIGVRTSHMLPSRP